MGDEKSIPPQLGKYRLYEGDVMDGLSKIPNGKIQCCVTSPPYFGLRDYGHDGQIGLEETPDQFVAKLVKVFREVRRVLRDDGTLWLNLGDSYFSTTKGTGGKDSSTLNAKRDETGRVIGKSTVTYEPIRLGTGGLPIKPKDLIGIPWRVAFALQADGWYLRQDIIWHKPNPMPESVRDRCTKAHEYVFLLTKNQRYFYDFDAMQEPAAYPNDKRRPVGSKGAWQIDGREQGENGGGKPYDHDTSKRNRRSVWTVTTKPFKGAHFATMPPALAEVCVLAGSSPGSVVLDPFGGSGTTAEVAMKHGRNAVLCELNPEYCKIARKRLGALK